MTVLVALACGSNSSVTTGPTQAKCEVTIAASASTVGADGGDGTVSVTAAPECPWDATSGAAWLSWLSPATGQGSGTVTFRAAPNPAPSSREAEIVVNDARVRVAQEAAPCAFDVQPGSLAVGAAGGRHSATVAVLSGCTWTVAADVTWIRIVGPASGSGPGTITVDVVANDAASVRSGTLAVANQRVTVTQDGIVTTPPPPPGCTYTLSAATAAVGAAGGVTSVVVTAGPACPWTAASTVPWITVTAGASGAGTGNGVVGLSVTANSGAARTGTLVVAGLTFTVSQAAAPPSCTFALASSNVSIGAPGGPGSVGVTAPGGCAWTAVSGAPWIAISAGASGSGGGTVTFDIAANAGAARTGTITIAGRPFTVSQAAATLSCSYGVSPTTASAPATGGVGAVGVTAATGCTWTAASSVAWIAITSGASGSGDGSVTFDVAANTGPARSATLTIAGQTVTVSQPAGTVSCAYALGSSAANVVATGGAGTVGVTAPPGCPWTASSNDAWISVTSGASGTGDGAVGFLVAANVGAARAGTLTIAGQTFTVNQAAVVPPPNCTSSISPTGVLVQPDKNSTHVIDVTAAAGCTWTAISRDTWIVVVSGASGAGNGTVVIDVAKSPGKKDRTGTVTIAGQTFTVIQKD